jgi:Outer membrane protein beta-barrel domain
MKNLAKLFPVILLTAMITASDAQTYMIKGGLNLSNMLFKDDDHMYSQDFKMNTGFHVGATIEIPLVDYVTLETGLLLSTKGYETEGNIGDATYKSSLDLYYLDIPITWKGYLNVGKTKVFAAIGPYVDIGLNGTDKIEITLNGQTETVEEKIDWGSEEAEADFKRMDMGLIFGGGIEFKQVQLGVSYNLGLVNILPYQGYGMLVKNRVLSISLGYLFGGGQVELE